MIKWFLYHMYNTCSGIREEPHRDFQVVLDTRIYSTVPIFSFTRVKSRVIQGGKTCQNMVITN